MKRTSIFLAALAVLAIAVAFIGKLMGERKMDRMIAITLPELAPASVERASIERGQYLFATRGCTDCHGSNGAGKTVINDGGMLVVAPNITTGANSVVSRYSTADWVRTIRHGVKPNGRPVMIMPSEDYARLTDEDMASLVAALRQLPPVAGERTLIAIPLPVKVLYAFGAVKDAAEKIDHTLPPPAPVAAAVTTEHGAYIANACIGCHGPGLSGGRIPGAPPAWPAAANLTPGKDSAMTRYPSPELFTAMLRSGHRPDGTQISPIMPFGSIGKMNDTDMQALHAYLKTVPPRDAGQR
ncbi:MAG TPA: cytochrome c [Telluria sp.]|nr:cytochrome c [Telluria sp.]